MAAVQTANVLPDQDNLRKKNGTSPTLSVAFWYSIDFFRTFAATMMRWAINSCSWSEEKIFLEKWKSIKCALVQRILHNTIYNIWNFVNYPWNIFHFFLPSLFSQYSKALNQFLIVAGLIIREMFRGNGILLNNLIWKCAYVWWWISTKSEYSGFDDSNNNWTDSLKRFGWIFSAWMQSSGLEPGNYAAPSHFHLNQYWI